MSSATRIQAGTPTDSAPPLLNGNYRYSSFDAVSAFLGQSPHLVNLLRESGPQVRHYFGAEATVLLELVDDPDGRDLPELFALIQVPLSAGSALDKLEQFDEEWWLGAAEAEDRLHFDLEYV